MSRYDTDAFGERLHVNAVTDAHLKPLGYQQITATGAAVGLAVPAGARLARISAEAQAVRWRDDGTAPTATVGMPIPVGTETSYSGNLAAIQFIASVAGAIVNVSYYG